jgi:transcriptional regulator with XRE-family HTH domain
MNTPIREARKNNKLTLEAVSREVGINSGHLSRIERGVGMPSPGAAQKLAKFFGITEEQIFYPERFIHSSESNQEIRRGAEKSQESNFPESHSAPA